MRMPARPSKPKKSTSKRPKVPEDQLALKTQCGFCDHVSSNPTLAVFHLNAEHEGEYSDVRR